ncbi:MAG: MFS transporter, partial [Firmicutes bacterium]|nr:MFS transporter [Bacillota bacterium]
MKERIITKNFVLLFTSTFATAMVMYMLMATITEYAAALGTTVMLAGLVSGIYVFGGLCSRLCAGNLMEKMGWKNLAIVAMILHLAACAAYFIAGNITVLIILRFIHGLGFGAAANATMTMGMSILPKSRYAEAAGYFMMSTTLAIAAGPYLGGIVYDHFGATGCFAAATLFSAIMLIAVVFADVRNIDPGPRKTKHIDKENAPKGIRKLLEPGAIPVSFCILLCTFGYASLISFYRLYAIETDLVSEFSIFFLVYAAILMVSRLFVGGIQDRYGANIICIPGIIAQCIGLVVIALWPCLFTIILCAACCAMGYGTLSGAFNVIVCSETPPERRSYGVTTFWLCCDGGMGLGPSILGAVATAAG